jgi:riboflavin kinase/FMN adenylyltransferase
MKVLHRVEDLARLPGAAHLAIGVFDGVHLGHRAVIAEAVRDAAADGGDAVVVTFDPHPQRILRPERAPRILTSTPHKLRLLRSAGISHLLLIQFDAGFAATDPADFIRSLAAHCRNLRSISVGHRWAFGKNRSGNLDLLRSLGADLGFKVTGVPEIQIDGVTVSSTFIRDAIRSGDLETASRFLGRPYGILGTVEEGAHLGRKLGFPTANLSAHSEQFPPDGVYAVRAILEDGSAWPAVANIGFRPTVEQVQSNRLLEVHIPAYSGNLYGQEMEVVFSRFLRPERKFENLEELVRQIEADVARATNGLD